MKKGLIVKIIVLLVILSGLFVFISIASNAKEKEYKIGDKGPGGGWVFYDKGKNSEGWRYLEAAIEDKDAKWGCEISIPDAGRIGIGTGKSNTQAITKNCEEANTAAQVCMIYRGGGKKDWFLPSLNELNLMYENLYKAGIGGFADLSYWSSSEVTARNAWGQNFISGDQSYNYKKKYPLRVRPIRAF